jgi:LacI family transcriptional regulator
LRRYLELPDRPKAVFAAADDIAMGFLAAAASHGLEPGRDFTLIGFDGLEQTSDSTGRTLTTIDVPLEEMGSRAGQLLIERLANPSMTRQRLYLGCRLFVGKTTV